MTYTESLKSVGLFRKAPGDSSRRLEQKRRCKNYNWQFWLIIALPLLWLIIFCYVPMAGIVLAFKNYSPAQGIFASRFVGLQWFRQFLFGPYGFRTIINTLRLGVYLLIVVYPLPIILAVFINEVGCKRFKKAVQMITYAPYFISLVVMVGMMMSIMDMRSGVINQIIKMFGGKALNFFGDPNIFPHLYVWSGIWQNIGYSSIIYIAALAGVSKELQEAALVDGAGRFQRIIHVDLPSIAPTIVMMLIFNVGSIMSIGFEKAYLMGNSVNASTSEIISTYLYKVSVQQGNYSYGVAVGLFNSLVSLILFVAVNKISRKLTDTAIW